MEASLGDVLTLSQWGLLALASLIILVALYSIVDLLRVMWRKP
jgi:hypothetical protein